MQQTFTVAQMWGAVLACCAAVCSISAAAAVVAKMIAKAKAPNAKQDERLTAIEARLAAHDTALAKDKIRIDAIEDGHRVSLRAQLALLSHALDGNDVDALRKSKDELQQFLINR